jgi:hypothetical protein
VLKFSERICENVNTVNFGVAGECQLICNGGGALQGMGKLEAKSRTYPATVEKGAKPSVF